MKNKQSHISLVFLILFSITLIPKEWIHFFHHHEETSHCLLHQDSTSIESQHEHCLVLQIKGLVSTHDNETIRISVPITFNEVILAPLSIYCFKPLITQLNRGPPYLFSTSS